MKTGQTLSQWAAEIERQQNAKADYIVDTGALTLNEKLELQVDIPDRHHPDVESLREQKTFAVQPLAHRQIASRLNIPAKYYDKMQQEAPELLRNNVNHWFAAQGDKRMIRTLDGQARAFLSNKYRRIDNHEVMNTILPILSDIPKLSVKSTQITDSKLYLKVVSEETQLAVPGSRRVGDFVESGIIVTNSEVGLGSLSIQPFFHFLVCTNGMVRNKDGMKAYHVGAKHQLGADVWSVLSDDTKRLQDQSTLAAIRDVVAASMDKVRFAEAVQLMAETTTRVIEGDVPKAVQRTAELLKMSDTEQSAVLRHLIEGGDLSQYGLMNAVTRTAEDLESYDRATEFEAMGGHILDLAPHQWRVISTAAA